MFCRVCSVELRCCTDAVLCIAVPWPWAPAQGALQGATVPLTANLSERNTRGGEHMGWVTIAGCAFLLFDVIFLLLYKRHRRKREDHKDPGSNQH